MCFTYYMLSYYTNFTYINNNNKYIIILIMSIFSYRIFLTQLLMTFFIYFLLFFRSSQGCNKIFIIETLIPAFHLAFFVLLLIQHGWLVIRKHVRFLAEKRKVEFDHHRRSSFSLLTRALASSGCTLWCSWIWLTDSVFLMNGTLDIETALFFFPPTLS